MASPRVLSEYGRLCGNSLVYRLPKQTMLKSTVEGSECSSILIASRASLMLLPFMEPEQSIRNTTSSLGWAFSTSFGTRDTIITLGKTNIFSGRTTKGVERVNPPDQKATNHFFL